MTSEAVNKLTQIQTLAQIFSDEIKGKYKGRQIRVVNETARSFLSGTGSDSEKLGNSVVITVELGGNSRERLSLTRDEIDDFAVSLGASVGYLTASGAIWPNPNFNPLRENQAELICISGYIFGEDPLTDMAEEKLDQNF